MVKPMIIDTHIHECTYSQDSTLCLEEIVDRARNLGLDGVCITDHDSMDISSRAKKYSQKTGFLILVGAEVLTYEGEIQVFGLPCLPKRRVRAQELLTEVGRHKAVAISAHPFRDNYRGLGSALRRVKGISAVEAYNGNTMLRDNQAAYNISLELDLPAVGASDAHHANEIGRYATRFASHINDLSDFVEAIKRGMYHPVELVGDVYREILA